MRFLRRRGGDEAPSEESKSRQASLALRRLLPELEGRNASVLDLGAANPSNLDFFAKRGANLTIADFYRSFLPLAANAPSKAELFRKLLPYDDATRFDVVLVWDLLNYLGSEEIVHLMESLTRFFRPGTMIHAFIVSAREMPATPSVYRILDETALVCEKRPGRSRPSPQYLEPALMKLMPWLGVENRYQLRNGMLEYIFSCRTRHLFAIPSSTRGAAKESASSFASGASVARRGREAVRGARPGSAYEGTIRRTVP